MHEKKEQIASIQNEIWTHWMGYLFKCCEFQLRKHGNLTEQIAILPADKIKRWKRQMSTPYHELSEQEKESDRHQADKIIALWKKRKK